MKKNHWREGGREGEQFFFKLCVTFRLLDLLKILQIAHYFLTFSVPVSGWGLLLNCTDCVGTTRFHNFQKTRQEESAIQKESAQYNFKRECPMQSESMQYNRRVCNTIGECSIKFLG